MFGTIRARIAVLESQHSDLSKDVTEIKAEVKASKDIVNRIFLAVLASPLILIAFTYLSKK